jgi:hypothetical protein
MVAAMESVGSVGALECIGVTSQGKVDYNEGDAGCLRRSVESGGEEEMMWVKAYSGRPYIRIHLLDTRLGPRHQIASVKTTNQGILFTDILTGRRGEASLKIDVWDNRVTYASRGRGIRIGPKD